MLKILVFIIGLFEFGCALRSPNNVCTTFAGYYTNQGCYYNPDQVLELPDIVHRYGFDVQHYEVITEDGYILSVFRIPSSSPRRPPVFLHHGIYASGITFLLIGKDSLGFLLAKAGYDVWLGNSRGTRYSRNHTYLSNRSLEYWNFSLHELGIYDIPAQVKLVYRITGKPIIYIGYSLGTVAGHVYSVMYPSEAQVMIKTMISLAPTAVMDISRSSLRFLHPFWVTIKKFVDRFFHGELFERGGLMSEILTRLCLPYPHQMKMCKLVIQSAFGFDVPQINPETLPIILKQNGDSVSVKTLVHQSQIIKRKSFQFYDYGQTNNLKLYGTREPPIYNVSRILVPNYLIYGKGDFVATENSVNYLYSRFSNVAKKHGIYAVNYLSFCHTDFTEGKNVKSLLYDHLLQFMYRL